MTKKDYVRIARIFKTVTGNPVTQRNPVATAVVEMLAQRISDACADDNDRFDSIRFLRACGI